MTIKTLPFDAAEGLEDAQTIIYFLEDAFAGGEAAEIAPALRYCGSCQRHERDRGTGRRHP